MPKQAFIHIGFDKTGTSAIQRYLATHQWQLARKTGLIYPDIGRERHQHVGLARAAGFGFRGMDDFAGWDDYVAALKALSRETSGRGVLISSEYFSYGQRPSRFDAFRTMFAPFDPHIIVYVRTLPSWLRSLYGETIKAGFQGSFDEFVHYQRERIDYAAILDQWAATFGADRLTVKIYEEERTALILSFLRILEPGISVKIRPRHVNPSLAPAELTVLQKANAILGHQDPAMAYRLYEFYLGWKTCQPDDWLITSTRSSSAFGEQKSAELMRLSERFAKRYLPANQDRFLRLTERDLSETGPPPLCGKEVERLAARLADTYRQSVRSKPALSILRRRTYAFLTRAAT